MQLLGDESKVSSMDTFQAFYLLWTCSVASTFFLRLSVIVDDARRWIVVMASSSLRARSFYHSIGARTDFTCSAHRTLGRQRTNK